MTGPSAPAPETTGNPTAGTPVPGTPAPGTPAPGTPALRISDLVVSYPLAVGRFSAVDHVSLTIPRGEAFGLVGESGSGKTTLAMAVLRLLRSPARIDAGSVRLGDTEVMALGERELRRVRWERMSLVPQGAMNSLNPVMRVRAQLADVILAHEGRAASRGLSERIEGLLATVGLPARVARAYPHELSGGMKQRVCIAMAVALRPELIIADEPTSALDVVVQRVVAQTLRDVQESVGASLVLIGHDMGLQAQVVDRLAVMYRGRVVETGSVRELFNTPVHPYTKLLIGSVPSIRGGARRVDRSAARATPATLEACALGDACPSPGHSDSPASPMHEVGPEHLVACRVSRRAA